MVKINSANAVSALQLIPSTTYIIYASFLVFFGIYVQYHDENVRNHACGSLYHLWKYVVINVGVWAIMLMTYLGYRGVGEGSRAKAMAFCSFTFALGVWGMLTWWYVSKNPGCKEVFEAKYSTIWGFQHLLAVTNMVVFVFYFCHESFLSQLLGLDLTVMPECTSARVKAPEMSPDVHHHPNPPAMAPAELPPQLTYEYDKIMQHTSSSTSLAQTTP